ncbi:MULTISPECIES: hypothetical protein [Bacteria]|uniref:Uncharacterized protein n=1 Tax=Cellulomonas carbonis T26 TaxID=947969 RepID=A0A0A0BP34_9CELL|nr:MULTISPECIES: hypothetical protein [Bacteria]KGM09452.1 hypothetical protein N868_02150 [Cellulomonas carbonis T26]
MMFTDLPSFYRSKEWRRVRRLAIERATDLNGVVRDEITHEPIPLQCDMVVHHVVELTVDNVNDLSVSLDLGNLKVVSFRTHNELHQRFGQVQKKVYWVWGSPFAGKLDFVKRNKGVADLVVDMGSIWNSINGGLGEYHKPKGLNPVAFAVRNCLLDSIMTRNGGWSNAWVVNSTKDESLINRLGAEPLYVDSTREDCIAKAMKVDVSQIPYVERWWDYCHSDGGEL